MRSRVFIELKMESRPQKVHQKRSFSCVEEKQDEKLLISLKDKKRTSSSDAS